MFLQETILHEMLQIRNYPRTILQFVTDFLCEFRGFVLVTDGGPDLLPTFEVTRSVVSLIVPYLK